MERQATQSRPQLVCILADNSPSMTTDGKATNATLGIRNMLMECQTRGPRGRDRSYFRLLLIRFDKNAKVDINMQPVRYIDSDAIIVAGDGDGTSLSAALDCLHGKLVPYIQELNLHPERDLHPVPLVLLFSDGKHLIGPPPQPFAHRIKQLTVGKDPVFIVAAGLPGDDLDPETLAEIASPGCYITCHPDFLAKFLATVGSSGLSNPTLLIEQQKRLPDLRG